MSYKWEGFKSLGHLCQHDLVICITQTVLTPKQRGIPLQQLGELFWKLRSNGSICCTARHNQIFVHCTDLGEQPCSGGEAVGRRNIQQKSAGFWMMLLISPLSQCSLTSSLMTAERGPSGTWSCGHPSFWAKVSSSASTARSGTPASTALQKMWVTDPPRG